MSWRAYRIDCDTKRSSIEHTFSVSHEWEAVEPYVQNDEDYGGVRFEDSHAPPLLLCTGRIKKDLEKQSDHAMEYKEILERIVSSLPDTYWNLFEVV
jgi:hypothetical protein